MSLEGDVWELIVGEDEQGVRLDKLLADTWGEEASRSRIQEWIRDGNVRVNGSAVKPNYKAAAGDEIVLDMPEPDVCQAEAEPIPLDVVYEDQDLIVLNKPRGMVVHPAPGHYSGTLVNALMHHCRDLSGINGILRPGIVHRIDRDTSGLLMAAKNDRAHQSLAAQLKEHAVERKYTAVVQGKVVHDQGTIDAPIGRDAQDRKRFTVTERNSKHAVTHFIVAERLPHHTVLELRLETGRTHQIRVHLKYIGHPIVGDPVYGRKGKEGMEGQALHAGVLGFLHPSTGERMRFEAPLPADMVRLLERLRVM